jgi:predicted metal-dependent hydrolase
MAVKEHLQIIKIGQEPDSIAVNLRVSLRTKRISIRISANKGVELVVPKKFNYERAHDFLISKQYWIKRQLSKHVPSQSISSNDIPIFGKMYQIVLVKDALIPVSLEEESILVLENQAPIVMMDLKFFLRSKLKEEVITYADKISQLLKVKYQKISIKDTSSRWGSCSIRGNLTFAWRLVFAPKFVMEYVVIHELCHLIEMNHSKRFWKLVSNLCPEYLMARRWLKKHSSLLHSYLKS